MENRFEGKTAVITGGAAGIGLAAATRIIAEGGNAILWDRSREAIVAAAQDLGPSCSGVSLDVTDLRALERAAAEAVREHGAIDVLIASAGITGPNATTWDYPLEAWRQVIEVNLTGVFCACKAVVPHMRARNAGRIVNIASIAGKEGNPNAPAYSASKAGVIGLTKSLGKELAGTPITVNCITPAAVRTAIFEQMSQQHIDYMLSKIPMNRFGTVEEIAALICFLASDEASFSTGAVFDISGGRATY
ncbi:MULTISPECIES: SDR family NAD(P)-dependent oxidoreductase [unclassified Acidiphilium]|uniref:SDR family oxidoreductase n=1 Tax=unclassified Acidiphilium TaxID=2617493 RepID=UPI000BDDC10B|nr:MULTISPECIES: SDR family NAD(P)-dependent oxidoreductase [unclassified Acidiphilium]OYV56388.1 MAG: 3-oxoacyl-ACP reductase [Acidiphilium sp. 20-67-58]HQT59934.1 SDR family NAD(P)-dependent oxidoreductase [Acidiphilium sp.]